ncbi:hypothetical protein BDN72DRAFT_830527 [Pluteus cervinus]|uniref:Uncharacterized protein n=1 Tax=Pluteus cervinus TaxID=181527 RepID=A0ACD3BHI9_9AGAR|nr:hypothetical protein BDN72DRAFT_830527 [Pluteus cervinus]
MYSFLASSRTTLLAWAGLQTVVGISLFKNYRSYNFQHDASFRMPIGESRLLSK